MTAKAPRAGRRRGTGAAPLGRGPAGLESFLVRSRTVPAAIVERGGGILEANAAFRRLAGPVGSLGEAVAEGQGAVVATLLDHVSREWRSAHAGLVSRDGIVVDCDVSAVGRGDHVLIVAEPLTEQAERLNHHLLELNDELIAARRELAASNRKLRELDELKNIFIASATHDLKTPITSILGYAELLADEELGDVQPMVSTIERNARRLVAMIDDLLGAALIISGELRLDCKPVDVSRLVREAVAMIEPVAAHAGLSVELAVDEGAVASVDERRVLQILDNLLSNAVKYSPDGGSVEVTCAAGPGEISVAVADHGIGISREEQARLFGRFFRASTARERGIVGTGLGLANARAFAEAHGGRLDCTSAEGVGSTFTLVLPNGTDES